MNGKENTRKKVYTDGVHHELRSEKMSEAFCRKVLELNYEKGMSIEQMGVEMTDIEPGWARGELTIRDKHRNTIGSIHGGVLFFLADTVVGFAAMTRMEEVTTASASIHYMNPVLGQKKLIAEATELKAGKNLQVYDVVITTEDGRLLTKATMEYASLHTTFMDEE